MAREIGFRCGTLLLLPIGILLAAWLTRPVQKLVVERSPDLE